MNTLGTVIDHNAMQAALKKLWEDPELEARFMRTTEGKRPAYNVPAAVDAESGIIVAQAVTTEATYNRSLLPLAEATQRTVGSPSILHVVTDAGYSNGEQAAECEARGIEVHVPGQSGSQSRREWFSVRAQRVCLRRRQRHDGVSGG